MGIFSANAATGLIRTGAINKVNNLAEKLVNFTITYNIDIGFLL
ncbi:hypothetical protein NIES2107_51880 [Nostoc carneum NIES-2107]|nr:hypothetical protein NIES2107_51880 [Nostoc carneum NIES-2107]